MQACRRIYVGLLVLVLIAITGMVYKWHAVSQLRSSTTTAVATTDDDNMSTWTYDKDDPRMIRAQQRIDMKYCGGPCRFLLPVFIMEQESKAQMHFRQLAFLSGVVNRTIVLPNVGGSRLGACLDHDFELYYSPAAWTQQLLLNSTDHHFQYISLHEFRTWVKERKAIGLPATSQNLHVHLARNHRQLGESENCFEPLLDMKGERHLYLEDSSNPGRREPYQDIVVEFLTGKPTPEPAEEEGDRLEPSELETLMRELEVLSVYYDRRYPLIHDPASEIPIPYSEKITELADKIAQEMSPYWAVHWRTERVEPPENLVECAKSLVELVQDRMKLLGLETQPTFFLLTDYPHTFSVEAAVQALNNDTTKDADLVPASASFGSHALTPYHHQAMLYLYEHFQVRVTNLEEEDRMIPPSSNWTIVPVSASLAEHDAGVLGILDKLLAIRADVFMAGQPGVCARRSSFTTRIIDERIQRLKDDAWKMKNVVEYFDL